MSVKKLLGAAAWKGLLLAVVTLLLLLAAAALMLQRGLVGESAASALVCAAYVAAVMIGGRSAIRSSSAPPLPQSLAVMHNLYFYNQLTQRIRDSLDQDCFEEFRGAYSKKLAERV